MNLTKQHQFQKLATLLLCKPRQFLNTLFFTVLSMTWALDIILKFFHLDIEGVDFCHNGSQMLWACRRLENSLTLNDDNFERKAGLRLSRGILMCCLDSVLKILAVPLNQSIRKKENFKNFL